MSVFASDASLPALPVPMVNITCEFIKHLMQPFCPPEQWEEASHLADDMKGQAQILQKALREYAQGIGGNASWLRPFWDDALLADRGRLPDGRTGAFMLHPYNWGLQPLPSLILGFCRFFQKLGRGDLPAESRVAGPLSMDSLRRMAYTRIPARHRDILHPVPLSGPARVAVVHRGHWFLMTVSNASGELFSANAVEKALQAIRELTPQLPEEPAVGAITASDREEAAELRAKLREHLENRINLDLLDESMFVVCLDDNPQGDDFGHVLLAGDAASRWFDKSLQIVYGPHNELGVIVERSGCDSSLWRYALGLVDEDLSAPGMQFFGSENAVAVRHLPFYVDSALGGELINCRNAHAERSGKLETAHESFASIKRNAFDSDTSASAFVQLAVIAAYYKTTGAFPPMVETVPVRRFFQGRTEVIRPVNIASVAFVRVINDKDGQSDATAVRHAYNEAVAQYAHISEICQSAQGPDRHIFGLRETVKMLEHSPQRMIIPELFDSPLWKVCSRSVVATEEATGHWMDFFAFSPLEEDGLGIGYGYVEDGLSVFASSRSGNKIAAEAFLDAFREVANRMLDFVGQKKS